VPTRRCPHTRKESMIGSSSRSLAFGCDDPLLGDTLVSGWGGFWPTAKGLRVNAQRTGAAGLLGAAALGIVAAQLIPRRYGRRGGLGVLGGVSVLLTRDAQMVLAGTPARLKLLPRALLYMELGSAATATCLGLAAWLRPVGHVRAPSGSSSPTGSSTLNALASRIAALTFLLHTLRQAIYLTPGHGRREGVADPTVAPTTSA